MSLYAGYVIWHDTVFSSKGQLLVCLPPLSERLDAGIKVMPKGTLAEGIIQLSLCGINRAPLLCFQATLLPHKTASVCVCVRAWRKRICTSPHPPLRMHVQIEASPGAMLYMHLLSGAHIVCPGPQPLLLLLWCAERDKEVSDAVYEERSAGERNSRT